MKSELKIDGNRMQITRIFNAPRERVFEAWKLPELMERWSGCKETTKVEFVVDFRVGGTFTQKMQIQHTNEIGEHAITGVYDEIIEPEKIAYHVNLGPATARVVVEFFDLGRQTKLVLTQDGFPDAMIVKFVSQGTMESLEKLDQLLLAQAA